MYRIKQKFFLEWMRECYDAINKEAFSGELPNIPITIDDTKENGANAYFCVNQRTYSYINKNGEHREYQIEYPSITIGVHNTYYEEYSELLYGIDLLAHEMVHFYCYLRGICDNNHETQYHYYSFLEAAENHGLYCRRWSEEFGFAHVSLTEVMLCRIIEHQSLFERKTA